MQGGPRGDEVTQGLNDYETMVYAFAGPAKAYWRLWGPLGDPMVRSVDTWAEMQRANIQLLRQTYEAGGQS
jgi:hypothetical protein